MYFMHETIALLISYNPMIVALAIIPEPLQREYNFERYVSVSKIRIW